MNLDLLCERMEANVEVIGGLYDGLAEDQLHWHPAPGKWSLLEVLCHLHDEELDDFRTRVDMTLHRPDEEWPRIDPEGWVSERRYATWDFEKTMAEWKKRRALNLDWLRELPAADWSRTHEHPKLGPLSAGDLLLSWVTHDHLHIAQIARLQLAYHREAGQPFSSRYAEP